MKAADAAAGLFVIDESPADESSLAQLADFV
jgi:hypothetical protein